MGMATTGRRERTSRQRGRRGGRCRHPASALRYQAETGQRTRTYCTACDQELLIPPVTFPPLRRT